MVNSLAVIRKALVAGAANGIGRATIDAVADAGAQVMGLYRVQQTGSRHPFVVVELKCVAEKSRLCVTAVTGRHGQGVYQLFTAQMFLVESCGSRRCISRTHNRLPRLAEFAGVHVTLARNVLCFPQPTNVPFAIRRVL